MSARAAALEAAGQLVLEPDPRPGRVLRCCNHYDRPATHCGVMAVDLFHPWWWEFKQPFRSPKSGPTNGVRLHVERAWYCDQCVAAGDCEWVGPVYVHHFAPLDGAA